MQENSRETFNDNKWKHSIKLTFDNDMQESKETKSLNPNKLLLNSINFAPRNQNINRDNKNKNEDNKVFQRSEFKPKTIANISDPRKTLSLKTNPQTSLEKIVNTMNRIKGKLIFYNESDLVSEIEWAIKEILSDNMYRIKIHEKTSKEESDFYNEYSNNSQELILSKDISNYGNFLSIFL